MSATDGNNPGNVLASAVDAEAAKFRQLENDVAKLQNSLQVRRRRVAVVAVGVHALRE